MDHFCGPTGAGDSDCDLRRVVMHLWNWLLPALFGWRQVTFWQALGLVLLCRILFGGFAAIGRIAPKRGGGCASTGTTAFG